MQNLLLIKIGYPELVLITFFGIIPLGLMIYSLGDIWKSKFSNSTIKAIWVLLIMIPVLGALLYLMVGKNKKVLH